MGIASTRISADFGACAEDTARIRSVPSTFEVIMPLARILVVDDEENIVNLIRSGLTEAGFEVLTASNGFAALQLMETGKPDLVIADVMMPRLSGIDLVRALRNRPETRRIPILLISAKDSPDAVKEGLEQGASDYITKPFKISELVGKALHYSSRRGKGT